MISASLRSLAWIAFVAFLGASASAQTIDASDRGWYNQGGLHTATNQNTLTGQGSGTDRFRSFFVFDLAPLRQPVGAGVLRLELEAYFGSDPMEYLAVWDVGTHPDELVLSQTGRADIYADLGGEIAYGAVFAQPSEVGSTLEIPLTPEAIAAINLAAGGRFAVGLSVETLRLPRGSEGVRFSLAGESRIHQLVLSEAPASLSVDPSLATRVPSAVHALSALVVDGGGAPMPGAMVEFRVESGPNAGATHSVAADESGAVSFSYAGQAPGVDRISALLVDGSASPPRAEAMAFWDEDCNANAIPDTCDLSCEGFGGDCATFTDCGGSLDTDASGLPDECDAAHNAPPDCSAASATPAVLPHADHRFREVAIRGVSDSDGDPLHVVVDAIFQDEPVEDHGFGATAPDARGVGGETVALRAESRMRGDGRVYHLSFSADDGRGGSCTGTALVCVPRPGWRRSDSCIDDGPLYDSTESGWRPRGHGWWWWKHRHHHGGH